MLWFYKGLSSNTGSICWLLQTASGSLKDVPLRCRAGDMQPASEWQMAGPRDGLF